MSRSTIPIIKNTKANGAIVDSLLDMAYRILPLGADPGSWFLSSNRPLGPLFDHAGFCGGHVEPSIAATTLIILFVILVSEIVRYE